MIAEILRKIATPRVLSEYFLLLIALLMEHSSEQKQM